MTINPFILHGEELTPVRKLLYLKALAGGAPLSEYEVTGNPVSFNTNVAKPLSAVAAFSPVQAGSGDPSPDNVRPITGWSGAKVTRSGKNLFSYNADNVKQEATSSSNTRAVYHTGIVSDGSTKFTLSAQPKVAGTLTNGNINVGYFENGVATVIDYFIRANGQDATPTLSLSAGREVIIIYTDSGVSGFKGNLEKYNIQIEIGDTASEYSAYTGESVSVTFPALGKNLANMQYGNKVPSVYSGEMVTSNGWISGYIPINANTRYILSTTDTTGLYAFYYGNGYTFIGYEKISYGTFNVNSSSHFSGCEYLLIRHDLEQNADIQDQVEVGETATAYEPYTNTAYGGTLDLSTGVLTVEWAKNTVDGSQYIDLNGITTYGGAQIVYTPYPAKKKAEVDAREDILSDKFHTRQAGVEYYISGRTANGNLYFNMPEDVTTVATAKTWFENNNTDVIYKLAVPLVYQLTPTEILSLVGDNVLWSDLNGDLTVTYKKKG